MLDLPNQFSYRYREFQRPGGSWFHEWTVEGPRGAVTFHVTRYEHAGSEKLRDLQHSAGLEVHHRAPPGYMADQAPSHHGCEAIGKVPCWHDGTSLYAEETLMPLLSLRDEPKMFFRVLVQEMSRFEEASC